MAESSETIAAWFLKKASESRTQLTPMQVNKLVYLAHGWNLGVYGRPLIPESVEAWKYGPVIPSIYHRLKHFKGNPVTDILRGTPQGENIPILEKIWQSYGQFTGLQLSTVTHESGTPWHIAWHAMGAKDMIGCPIPDSLIQAHYKEKYESNQRAAGAASAA